MFANLQGSLQSSQHIRGFPLAAPAVHPSLLCSQPSAPSTSEQSDGLNHSTDCLTNDRRTFSWSPCTALAGTTPPLLALVTSMGVEMLFLRDERGSFLLDLLLFASVAIALYISSFSQRRMGKRGHYL